MKMWKKSGVMALLLVAMAVTMPQARADFKTGMIAYTIGNYEVAMKEWRPIAEAGDPTAQFYLGVMYANNEGVRFGEPMGMKWYRKAAEQGHADAQYNLGLMFNEGYGIPKNHKKAVEWWKKAAAQNHGKAMYNLAVSFYDGIGTIRNRDKAIELWMVAAKDHNIQRGFFNVAIIKAGGYGVSADYIATHGWMNPKLKSDSILPYEQGWWEMIRVLGPVPIIDPSTITIPTNEVPA